MFRKRNTKTKVLVTPVVSEKQKLVNDDNIADLKQVVDYFFLFFQELKFT